MKFFRIFLFLIGIALVSKVEALPPLPDEFYVRERWFALSFTLDIESTTAKFGTVHREFWRLRTIYDFYDTEGNLQAKAKIRWLSLGAVFDVEDSDGVSLGQVDERLLTFFSTFDIISPSKEILATAKLNFWGTKYTIRDPLSKEVIATLSRPYIRLVDNWTVRITNPDLFALKKIDPRLFITVMAFQTDRGAWSTDELVIELNGRQNMVEPPTCLAGVEPTEQDFIAVVDRIESIVGESEDVDRYVEILEALFEDERLSPGQREAVAYLLSDSKRGRA